MTQKRWWINAGLATALAGLAILAAGCEHDEYTLRMSVEGDVLVRSLEVQRVGLPVEADENGEVKQKTPPQVAPELLAMVGKAYDAKPEKKENTWTTRKSRARKSIPAPTPGWISPAAG